MGTLIEVVFGIIVIIGLVFTSAILDEPRFRVLFAGAAVISIRANSLMLLLGAALAHWSSKEA